MLEAQDQAEMILDGTSQSNEQARHSTEIDAQILYVARDHEKGTNATHRMAGDLQTSLAGARAKATAATEHSVSSASSSCAAMDRKNAVIAQLDG